jgi:carboxyl-terminal processing protease
LDEYSGYLTADEYEKNQIEGQGNQTGIGVVISKAETDGFPPLRIMRVCGNSPAEAAGLQAGEYIVGIGTTAENIAPTATFEAFSTALSAFADATDIYLRIQNGDTIRTVCVQKQVYVENYVFYRTNTSAYRFAGQNALERQEYAAPLVRLPGNAAYIRLTQFNGNALEQFEQAMSLFKQQNKQILVLDLRQNGGGYVRISTEIAGYFCKQSVSQKPVVAIADYGEEKTYFQASKNVYSSYFSADSKIYVLADDGTASASEMLLGCMLDYGAIAYNDICLIYNCIAEVII